MREDSRERMQILRELVEARRREEQRLQEVKAQIRDLQFILEEKVRFEHYLNHLAGVTFAGYYDLDPVVGKCRDLFYKISDPRLIATSRIRTPFYNREFLSYAPIEQLIGAWLKLCLKRLGIENNYYLAFGQHMNLIGWTRVKVSDDGDWLARLYDDINDVRDLQFLILSSDFQRIFAFFTWEMDYRAQIRRLSAIDTIKPAFSSGLTQ